MRVSINSAIVAALLSGIPFPGVVRSYPIGGTSDIQAFSKRGISPKPVDPFRTPSPVSDPFRDPSPGHGDPFRDPSTSPSIPGSPSAAGAWRGFADGALNPGNTVQESQRARGEQLLQSLDTAILHNSGSDKIDKSMKDAGYVGQGETHDATPPLGLQNYLRAFGIAKTKTFTFDKISKPDGESIVETFEDPNQKVLIVTRSYNKEHDPEGALSWTAMVMSNWRNAATTAKSDVKDLKYVVRHQVQTIDTTTSDGVKLNSVNAINGAFNALDVDKTKTLTLDVKTQNEIMMEQVLIMSAQTHVARVIQMLQDYRNELGNLNIARLHLQTPNNPVSDFQYNIMWEFWVQRK